MGDRSALDATSGKLNIKAASNTLLVDGSPIFAGTTLGADAWATSSGGGLVGIGGGLCECDRRQRSLGYCG